MFSRVRSLLKLGSKGLVAAAAPFYYKYQWMHGKVNRTDVHKTEDRFDVNIKYNTPHPIENNRINICNTNKENINNMLENPDSHVMISGLDQIIIDYDKIDDVSSLDKLLNNIKNKERTLVIICNKNVSLDIEYYNEAIFQCLDKYKDRCKIVYLCRNEQMYPVSPYNSFEVLSEMYV